MGLPLPDFDALAGVDYITESSGRAFPICYFRAEAFERRLAGRGYEKASRSRIKLLRGLLRPQYRLRVDEVRVF
jgi:hypothetical protein